MKKRALFIGVDEYEDVQIRNLSCSLQDAYALKAMFEILEYETAILNNPAKSDVFKAVRKMTTGLSAGDFFFFYFAGHGWTTTSGKHLLFCKDDMYEDLRIDEAGISFDKLKMRTESGGFNRAFVLDACRTDFVSGTRGADTTTRDLRPITELVDNAPHNCSLAVLRSCSQFQHALEIEARGHGLFTLAFLDVLKQSQASHAELLFGETLCDAVTARMTMIAREERITEVQTPEFAKSGEAPVLISGWKVDMPTPPPASPQPPISPMNLVVCPFCGKNNEITETFNCRVCGKEHLCLKHYNEEENCCGECAEDLVRKREEEKRQKEAAECTKEEDRKRREEAERKRPEHEAEERKREESVPFFTLDLSGVPLKMIKVKAGRFLMGSPENELGRFPWEQQHWVTLTQDYWLAETPVTQLQWMTVMGNNPSKWQIGDNSPVECVSWYDAKDFCNKLNQNYKAQIPSGYELSLPTEAQWEYACRAETITALNSGKNLLSDNYKCANLDKVGWYRENSDGSTHFVGQKTPNAWGFYDMHGNVWEWCSDLYEDYHGKENDPQGASSGLGRVRRGGAWSRPPKSCRSADRDYVLPDKKADNLGFRLALVPVIEDKKTETFSGILNLSGIPLKLIKVKAGCFIMGSPIGDLGRFCNEIQHSVTLTKDYWLGETQVTQGQWKAVMDSNPSGFQKGDDYPVERVSWDDAMSFCNKLNQNYSGTLPSGYEFSLPTEAQWEYACRAETTTALNNGKSLTSEDERCPNLDEVGWYDKNSGQKTHPVGQKRPNAWGFYDMHGNVWEWCGDWYDNDYGCDNNVATNPRGPSNGSNRVYRGGSWSSQTWRCRSAFRGNYSPSLCGNYLGFRLALVPIQ